MKIELILFGKGKACVKPRLENIDLDLYFFIILMLFLANKETGLHFGILLEGLFVLGEIT